jgi:hypothetical protein
VQLEFEVASPAFSYLLRFITRSRAIESLLTRIVAISARTSIFHITEEFLIIPVSAELGVVPCSFL